MSADTPVSKFVSYKNWTAMFAGKLGDCRAITKSIKATVESSPSRVDEISMMHIAQRAFTDRHAERSSFPVLSPHHLDYAQFEKDGKKRFTTKEHARLTSEISKLGWGFDAQLLICGWGQHEPTLFTLDSEGPTLRDAEGFAAIGSGGAAANVMLMFWAKNHPNSLHVGMNVYAALLYVAGAKFFAERTDGVGINSNIRIATRGTESIVWLSSDDISKLRHKWNTTMAPAIAANNIQDEVEGMLGNRLG
ncbi:MAG TPA: hypothetical protein VK829_11190 [Terriglobales bacterium]|nr:hypothetical protein [Terriglobales bacterium]